METVGTYDIIPFSTELQSEYASHPGTKIWSSDKNYYLVSSKLPNSSSNEGFLQEYTSDGKTCTWKRGYGDYNYGDGTLKISYTGYLVNCYPNGDMIGLYPQYNFGTKRFS